MDIHIESEGKHLRIPVPTILAGAVARLIPGSAFKAMQQQAPPALRPLITRKNFRILYHSCAEVLAENKGLEIIHVESANGDKISIVL